MYKGESAAGNHLVVAMSQGCSGAVIAPRIVATAAHCPYEEGVSGIFQPGGKQDVKSATQQCGNSCVGETITGIFAKAVARIKPPGNFQENRALDVAIWILDREVNINSYVQIASKSDVDRFAAAGFTATVYGYGHTSANIYPELPSFGKAQFSPENTVMQGVKEISSQGYAQFTALGAWTLCGGDSGGPLYVEENGINYYLGNIVASSVSGCTSEVTSASFVLMNYFHNHLDLLEEAKVLLSKLEVKEIEKAAAEKAAAEKAAAEKAAAEKAAAEKKKLIVCVKGKVVKKVTSSNPKCPSGFKIKK